MPTTEEDFSFQIETEAGVHICSGYGKTVTELNITEMKISISMQDQSSLELLWYFISLPQGYVTTMAQTQAKLALRAQGLTPINH